MVLCTCGNEEEARRLAHALVEARVAACVSLAGGVSSVYRWKAAVESASEWLLIIKSSRAMFEKLRAEIEKLHSYEVPEVLALSVVDGAEGYLNWLEAELGA
ncbi:MAG: divalent-cation tolerance protein CutA [Bryobacteraceae bacterium]